MRNVAKKKHGAPLPVASVTYVQCGVIQRERYCAPLDEFAICFFGRGETQRPFDVSYMGWKGLEEILRSVYEPL